MNIFDLVLVQPIFNILLLIYSIIPGHDFGVALILFTVIIRFMLWPLVRKQLHQTKVMQALQPEIAKIKAKTKGNRPLESQLMMELYRERGVNPLGSIGLLILQLPVLLTLYSVVRLITVNTGPNIAKYAYPALHQLSYVKDIIAHPGIFNDHLFGVIDLSKTAFSNGGVNIPVLAMAIVAAALQFWQSRQLLPKVGEDKKLRDVLKEQAAGKAVDQSEMNALMSRRMSYMFPFITFMISIYLAGALVLYLLTTSAVAVIQQRLVLKQDDKEMEAPSKQATRLNKKLQSVQEAEVVERPKSKKKEE